MQRFGRRRFGTNCFTLSTFFLKGLDFWASKASCLCFWREGRSFGFCIGYSGRGGGGGGLGCRVTVCRL